MWSYNSLSFLYRHLRASRAPLFINWRHWYLIHDLSLHLSSCPHHPSRSWWQELDHPISLSHISGTPYFQRPSLPCLNFSPILKGCVLEEIHFRSLQLPASSLMPLLCLGSWSFQFLSSNWPSPLHLFLLSLFGVRNRLPFPSQQLSEHLPLSLSSIHSSTLHTSLAQQNIMSLAALRNIIPLLSVDLSRLSAA